MKRSSKPLSYDHPTILLPHGFKFVFYMDMGHSMYRVNLEDAIRCNYVDFREERIGMGDFATEKTIELKSSKLRVFVLPDDK